MPKKKTHSEFLADFGRLNAHADNLEIESEYQGSKAPVDVRCLRCGHKWMTMPGTLLQGCGCPRCGEKQLRRKKTYTDEKFLEKLAKVNPEAEPLMEYTKGSSYIDVRCKRCGTIWSSKGYNLLQGKGCPHCGAIRGARNNQGKTGVKTREQFSAELAEASPDIEVLGDYVNVHTKIKVRCRVCGHVWSRRCRVRFYEVTAARGAPDPAPASWSSFCSMPSGKRLPGRRFSHGTRRPSEWSWIF